MFISNSSSILQQQKSNRFNIMLDPSNLNDLDNNHTTTDDETTEYIQQQLFLNDGVSNVNNHQPMMHSVNHFMDDNNGVNNSVDNPVTNFTTRNLHDHQTVNHNFNHQHQPQTYNNFHSQSVNVDLSDSISNDLNTSSNYNINAGQSYYNHNISHLDQYSAFQAPSSYSNQFIPPQPMTNSSTSSSLQSYIPHQSHMLDYNNNNTPSQSSFPDTNLYMSNSLNSFFDSTPTTINTNVYSSPHFSDLQPQNFDQPQPLHHSTSLAPAPSRSSPSQKQTPTLESLKKENTKPFEYDSDEQPNKSRSKRYRVVRGVSAGGCSTKPPKESMESDSMYLPVELNVNGARVKDICLPKWSASEKEDRRRIIRIERLQHGPKLYANFSIVGGANENPITLPPPPNVDVAEVSCLECDVRVNDEYESQSSDEELQSSSSTLTGGTSPKHSSYVKNETDGEYYQYYITSVEVVEIVELLIGTQAKDAAQKRKERGRVRSNLVPFWSKRPISSRMSDPASSTSTLSSYNTNTSSSSSSSQSLQLSSTSSSTPSYMSNADSKSFSYLPSNHDFKMELAKRIMGYEIRKPRGFDKEVRILRWDKLIPALKRALQSYYTEIPQGDSHLQF